MRKVLNVLLVILRYLLLFLAFGSTLYVCFCMYNRLGKNFFDLFYLFMPYLILLLLFVLNVFLKNRIVNKSIFYNVVCCMVFFVNILVCYRSLFDSNMVLGRVYKTMINFNYFNDYLAFNRIMLYGLIISTIFFMFSCNREN